MANAFDRHLSQNDQALVLQQRGWIGFIVVITASGFFLSGIGSLLPEFRI